MQLKEFRDLRQMSQKDIAALLGVDFTTVSLYERHRVFPPWQAVMKIEELTDGQVTFYDFVEGHKAKCLQAG